MINPDYNLITSERGQNVKNKGEINGATFPNPVSDSKRKRKGS